MAEPDRKPEGWQVPFRRTATIAGIVPFVLLALLALAGWAYDRTLRPRTMFDVSPLPAPALETRVNTPGGDPQRAAHPTPPDPRIAAAKARVATQGLADWNPPR
jgi:hypothetical protein